MKMSQLCCPTLREIPSDTERVSHQLMLRAGFIRQLSSGLYSWLPLGLKVLKKVMEVVREHMDEIGAQEILMPSIQPAELWKETGRWEKYGPMLLKMQDRNERAFCFGPTHEEVVTHLMQQCLRHPASFPQIVYQIQTKFRDEIRPRFGVMRAREFIMKDAYSFHLSIEDLQNTYTHMYEAYERIFKKLGLQVRAVLGDGGEIGGHLSHEFHVLADSGEDDLLYSDMGNFASNKERLPSHQVGDRSPDGEGHLLGCKGIEVGHIFQLGTQYPTDMHWSIPTSEKIPLTPFMGCYGIGVSRIVAATIEQHHDARGMIWPTNIAPFLCSIVPIQNGGPEDEAVRQEAFELYAKCREMGIDTLLEDRRERPGVSFADIDLIGIPHRIVISAKTQKTNGVEYKSRTSDTSKSMSYPELYAALEKQFAAF